MIFHFSAVHADLNISLVNDSESRDSIPKMHFYNHLTVSLAMAVVWAGTGKGEIKVHCPNLDKSEPPIDSTIILPEKHKQGLLCTLSNNTPECEIDPIINAQ